jgi:hypothetical protein
MIEVGRSLEAAHPARATLRPTPDDAYTARLPLARRGRWELRFTVVRTGERFTTRVHREAAGPTP